MSGALLVNSDGSSECGGGDFAAGLLANGVSFGVHTAGMIRNRISSQQILLTAHDCKDEREVTGEARTPWCSRRNPLAHSCARRKLPSTRRR